MDQKALKKVLFSTSDQGSDSENQNQGPNLELSSPPRKIQEIYAFGDKLGEGSTGSTYICTNNVTGHVYACKKIEKETSLYRMKREIAIMKMLRESHPNIVTLEDCYQDDDAYYLVMEMGVGGTLQDQMRAKGRYTEMEAAIVIRQIVQALKCCHEHGVIHHDLKPDNIVFMNKDTTSNLKLIDFGFSTTFQHGTRLHSEHYGTPSYKAPELFVETEYGPEIDIWSTGVILYELLYGTLPFRPEEKQKHREYQALGKAVCKGVKGFNWKQTLPGISDDAVDLLKKMLAKKDDRITAEEALAHPWMQTGSTS